MTTAEKWFLLVLIALANFLPGRADNLSRPDPVSPKQKGISYVAWRSDAYLRPESDQSLAHLRETSADWIALIVTQYQENITSTEIQATGATPSDASLIHAIETAHRLGLKVMLKPHVDLSSDPQHWRGQINPGLSILRWNTWFASYNQFILHYARLASDQGVEQFCVGTELSKTQRWAGRWRQIIAEVREVYTGPLVYAANHGDENGLTWWDAVDMIGVDAYYPLSRDRHPTVDQLKSAWKPHIRSLALLAARENKPVLFTEIGYRSIAGTASAPADYRISAPLDMQGQQNAYQAALESVYDQPWFAGLYWWSWNANAWDGGSRTATILLTKNRLRRCCGPGMAARLRRGERLNLTGDFGFLPHHLPDWRQPQIRCSGGDGVAIPPANLDPSADAAFFVL